MNSVDLSLFDNSWFDHGKGLLVRILWYFINALFFRSSLNPSSGIKVFFLRLFGAKVGTGVVIKPSVNIKYPWKLEIGNHSWVGENAWLDTLAPITIGNNCCISQAAYLCTGNHNWTDPAFGLIVKPILLEDGSWVGAGALILPGVTLKNHSIVAAGAVISNDTEPYMIYAGNPALVVKKREIINH